MTREDNPSARDIVERAMKLGQTVWWHFDLLRSRVGPRSAPSHAAECLGSVAALYSLTSSQDTYRTFYECLHLLRGVRSAPFVPPKALARFLRARRSCATIYVFALGERIICEPLKALTPIQAVVMNLAELMDPAGDESRPLLSEASYPGWSVLQLHWRVARAAHLLAARVWGDRVLDALEPDGPRDAFIAECLTPEVVGAVTAMDKAAWLGYLNAVDQRCRQAKLRYWITESEWELDRAWFTVNYLASPDAADRPISAPRAHLPPTLRKGRNHARDKWLLAQYKNPEHSLQAILTRLEEIGKARNWAPINTAQGIFDAVRRYCKKTGQPCPRRREA